MRSIRTSKKKNSEIKREKEREGERNGKFTTGMRMVGRKKRMQDSLRSEEGKGRKREREKEREVKRRQNTRVNGENAGDRKKGAPKRARDSQKVSFK